MYIRRLRAIEDIKIKINISLDELFEFIYWCSHFKKYNTLCCKLEELKIPVMTVTPDKDGEIQKIIYEKENEFTIRTKYLIDDQFLEPLGLNLHSLIYIAKTKNAEKNSVLDEFKLENS